MFEKELVQTEDGQVMTRAEARQVNCEMAKEKGNLDGRDVDLFLGKSVRIKTSFNEIQAVENESKANATGIAHLLMKGSPKKKVGNEQLTNLLQLAYYLGAVNTAKEVNYRFDNFYSEEEMDKDLAQGEAQVLLHGAWEAIRKNRIGSQVFLRVDLEQIMKDADLNNFIRMPKNVRL